MLTLYVNQTVFSSGLAPTSEQEISTKFHSVRSGVISGLDDECYALAREMLYFNQEVDLALSGRVLIFAGARLANYVRVKRCNQESLIGHYPADLHKSPICMC